MKNTLFFVCIYCISPAFMAQNVTDVETIINLCIYQTELVPQNHLSAEGISEVTIVDNGVLPIGISLDWFDAPVQFKNETQIAATNISAYLKFDSFEILTLRHAKATYTYVCSGDCITYKYELEFTKYTQFWTISRNKTIAINEISFTGLSKSSF